MVYYMVTKGVTVNIQIALGSPHCMQELSFVEFYAGVGRTWRAVRADGVNAVGVDLNYHSPEPGEQNHFDIMANCGFALGAELYTHGDIFSSLHAHDQWHLSIIIGVCIILYRSSLVFIYNLICI